MAEVSEVLLNKDKLAQQVLTMFKTAKEKRGYFEPVWEDVATYVLPYHGGFYSIDNSPATINLDARAEIYDDTAINSLQKTASALYSFTANPATYWFSFAVPPVKSDKGLDYNAIINSKEVKDYLIDCRNIVSLYLNKAISSAMHSVMQEAMAFSTSAIMLVEEEDPTIVMSGQAISIRDLFILENKSGRVDKFFRAIRLSNEQAMDEFGLENLHPTIKDEVKENDFYKERIYLHAVYPRRDRNIDSPFNKDKAFASVWVDVGNSFVVKESGYDEIPYGVARINVPAGFVYGFAPGMNIIHTVKGLNKLARQKLEAGDKALNPPMNIPMETYPNSVNLKPAALNYFEADSSHLMTPVHDFGNIQIADSSIQDARQQVKEGLLNDLIQPTKGDTTYQNQQEQLLQMRLMAPWQGGFERDLLGPLVYRAFRILSRRSNILPEMPEVLKELIGDKPLSLVYESPLAKAQQFIILQGIDRTIQFAGGLAPLGAMDSVNIHEAVKIYSELSGAPGKIIRGDKEVEKIQSDRVKMQEEQMKLQAQQNMSGQISAGAKAAKDLSDADVEKLKEFLGAR